jgi:hypothetical protein
LKSAKAKQQGTAAQATARSNVTPNSKRGRPRGALKPRYKTIDEAPECLRARDIYHLFGTTPAELRKARCAGTLKCFRPRPGRGAYYYPAKQFRVAPVHIVEPLRVVDRPLPPLLRLRDVINIGLSRASLEILCRDRSITPFYKNKGSKALYPTWQFAKLFGSNVVRIQPQPRKRWLRRKEVARWLRVRFAEIESWVRLGIVKRHPATDNRVGTRGWGYFDRDEIKQKVLGVKRIKNAE